MAREYRTGLIIGGALTAAGFLLQFLTGTFDWKSLAFPANAIILFLFIILLIVADLSRERFRFFRWMSTVPASVTSIGLTVILTLIPGLIRQESLPSAGNDFPGLDKMLSHWAFILTYFWMTACLGMTILRVCIPLKRNRIPFLLNHLGLFIVLICGAAGAADLLRLKMTVEKGVPQWRATDAEGNGRELPFAVELDSFIMEEYLPKLMLVDMMTGEYLPPEKPENITLENGTSEGRLGEWTVSISGNEENPFVKASKKEKNVEGYVSCGIAAIPPAVLKLDEKTALVMPAREAKRYLSNVTIYLRDSTSFKGAVEVNHPGRLNGWKIYQSGYDRKSGRDSRFSILEIVRDPWMPAVYTGFFMLMAGAVCMFVKFGTRRMK